MKTIITISLIFSCIYTQHTEYFSTLKFVESPFSKINGSKALTKLQAYSRNHYRFEYDQSNQLVEIAFYNKHKLQNPNHTANLFFLSSKVKINYKKDLEIYTFYNRFDQKTTVLGGVNQFVYRLDDEGYRKELIFLDLNHKQVQNSWNIYKYNWTRNHDGSVIENRYNLENEPTMIRPGFEFYRIRLTYNVMGHISLMQNINFDGTLIENSSGAAQDRIETNIDGNMLAWNVLDKDHKLEKGNGPNVARGTQSFNEFGYETRINYFDEIGTPIKTSYGFWGSKTQFDNVGNIIERVFVDGKGNPHPHEKAGYVYLKISYDQDGYNRKELSYYDINQNPVVHKERGYHRVKYTYDDFNNLLSVRYLNTNNDPVNRLDNNVSYILYRYDSEHKRISTKQYDHLGKEILK